LIQVEAWLKRPVGWAVRYTLKNWTALTRYCEDGDLQIDNNATERTIRGVAVGRNNWVCSLVVMKAARPSRCCGVSCFLSVRRS
jgi:hypothetical protein